MENTNYTVSTMQGEFILTLYEHYSIEELPVKDKAGQILQSLAGKPAALIECLSGKALATTEASI